MDLIDKTEKKRDSSIELYRIIVMLFIVMHHYVINSGLTTSDGPISGNLLSWRSIFLLLFGAWGKTGINCFVLITGYFMSKAQITLKKFLKLLFEVEFYRIVIWIVFFILGYETFSLQRIIKLLLPFINIETNFTGCFLVFYLMIPFLNILINNMDEKLHQRLIMLLGFVYIVLGTVPAFEVRMNYVSWFCVLYIIAAYIRFYPKKIYDNRIIWGYVALGGIFIASCSVVRGAWISAHTASWRVYEYVSDSNNFLPVIIGISSFLYFKNLNMKYNKFINTVAASTFGVLQIHANSGAMRTWLWKDTLNNVGMYHSTWLGVHAIGSVIVVYSVCTMIDYLRIKLDDHLRIKLKSRCMRS